MYGFVSPSRAACDWPVGQKPRWAWWILDEFEHSDQRREALTDVLALLRASSTGGAGRLRGTKTLGARVDRLDVPVMAGAVEPIGANDADFNRWMVTGLAHVEGKEHPGTALRNWCALRKIDWEGLRRAVTLGLADRVDELQRAHDEVSQLPDLAGDAVIDSRFLEGIHPVLAVARVLGRDPRIVARLLVDAKGGQTQDARVNRRGNRLLEAILAAPITIPDPMNRPQRTTLAWLLSPQPLQRFALPELGITAEEDQQHPDHVLLWVYWPTAYRSELLRGSEFAQDRVDNLASVAADGDCWVDNGQQKRVGALGNKKTTLFRIPRARIHEALGL